MELILQFLGENLSQIPTSVILMALIGLFIYNIRDNKKTRDNFNNRFDSQDKEIAQMKKEYQDGFEEIRREYQSGFEEIRKEIKYLTDEVVVDLVKQQKENYLMTLRTIVTNDSLPREYRLGAYDKYKIEGGNSWVSSYVKKNLLNDKEQES